jgi:hypothetical protein
MQLSFASKAILLGSLLSIFGLGCTAPWSFKTDPNSVEAKRARIRQRLEATNRPTSLAEVAAPRQLTLGALENIGLVTHLPGTGGPAKPSQPRERLLDIMRRNDVPQPNSVLDSKQTAMVLAFTAVPPAARKGDRINVSVKLSTNAEAADLRQGWLRETALVEMGNLGGKIRESFERARAEGPLVTLAQYTGSEDPEARLEAVVVGGARLLKARELGLGISSEFSDALTMAAVVPAINQRFTYFDGHKQTGIATPLSDDYIELQLPARYTADPYHFVNVVMRINFNESQPQREVRLTSLASQLLSPDTVRDACWSLEAIGEEAKEILAGQINNPDPEIRFYCAHSLAYLGDRRAVAALVELCTVQPAFRAMCFNAMASMDSFQAEEGLKSLLSLGDFETRYGAVRALRRRNRRDPLVTGHHVTRVGDLLEIPSSAESFVAVSMFETPEIVFFGPVPELTLPAFHNVNKNLLIQASGKKEVSITHFMLDQDDISIVCPADLRSVLQGIAQVGGGYGDWVSFVRECQELGFISTPVAMNPVPSTGRSYDRETSWDAKAKQPEESEAVDAYRLTDEVEQTDTPWYKLWPSRG